MLTEDEVAKLRARIGWKPEWQKHMVKGGDSPEDASKLRPGERPKIKTASYVKPTSPHSDVTSRCSHCRRRIRLHRHGRRIAAHGFPERCPGSLREPLTADEGS